MEVSSSTTCSSCPRGSCVSIGSFDSCGSSDSGSSCVSIGSFNSSCSRGNPYNSFSFSETLFPIPNTFLPFSIVPEIKLLTLLKLSSEKERKTMPPVKNNRIIIRDILFFLDLCGVEKVSFLLDLIFFLSGLSALISIFDLRPLLFSKESFPSLVSSVFLAMK